MFTSEARKINQTQEHKETERNHNVLLSQIALNQFQSEKTFNIKQIEQNKCKVFASV